MFIYIKRCTQTFNSLVLSHRNQPIDLQSKTMDWFLYDRDLRHEWVKMEPINIVVKLSICACGDPCYISEKLQGKSSLTYNEQYPPSYRNQSIYLQCKSFGFSCANRVQIISIWWGTLVVNWLMTFQTWFCNFP